MRPFTRPPIDKDGRDELTHHLRIKRMINKARQRKWEKLRARNQRNRENQKRVRRGLPLLDGPPEAA